MIIWYLLIFEHTYNWITTLYRFREINDRGTFNVHGIKRAPVETTLRSIQIYFDCLLIGLLAYYLIQNLQTQVKQYPLIHFCMIWSAITTFLLPGYVYLSQIQISKSENMNRVVTLSMLQF